MPDVTASYGTPFGFIAFLGIFIHFSTPKWIICFSPMLLKVFFRSKAIIFPLENENLLAIGNKDYKRRLTN